MKEYHQIGRKYFCARCGAEQKGPAHAMFSFMRHGRTRLNAENRSVGSIDEPMDEVGIGQAEEAARRMKKEEIVFDAIVTSTLIRAVRTSEIAAPMIGNPPIIIEWRLRERCIGIQEGQPETLESDSQWLQYDFTLEGAEPLREYEREKREFLSDIKWQYRGKQVLFITHGFAMLTLVKFIKGLTIEEVTKFEPPGNCQILTFALIDMCTDAKCGSEFAEIR